MNTKNEEPMNAMETPAAARRPNFDIALDHVLRVEGGEYTDHPADAGGPTKFGITLQDLRDYRGDQKLQANDVKNLGLEEAKQIYKARYWDKMNLGFLDDQDFRIPLSIMDQGVNRGTKTAVMLAQVVMNTAYTTIGVQSLKPLTVDGVLGPVTRERLSMFNPEFFAREFIQAAQHGYLDIVKRKPNQMVFMKGWLNRTHVLEDLCWDGRISIAPDAGSSPKPVVTPDPVPKKQLDRLAPYQWAKGEMGVKEISGRQNTARIVYYHSFTSLHATDDETAWCASFMNAAGANCGFKTTRSAAAKSWDTYGIEGTGAEGDIVTLRHLSNGGRHVGFLAKPYKKGDKYVYLLGGNQGNMVNITAFPGAEVVAIRQWVAA